MVVTVLDPIRWILPYLDKLSLKIDRKGLETCRNGKLENQCSVNLKFDMITVYHGICQQRVFWNVFFCASVLKWLSLDLMLTSCALYLLCSLALTKIKDVYSDASHHKVCLINVHLSLFNLQVDHLVQCAKIYVCQYAS